MDEDIIVIQLSHDEGFELYDLLEEVLEENPAARNHLLGQLFDKLDATLSALENQ